MREEYFKMDHKSVMRIWSGSTDWGEDPMFFLVHYDGDLVYIKGHFWTSCSVETL